jgi:hypothetical protein
MLCMFSVPKEMKKEYDAVHKQMMEAIAKVKADQQAGRQVELCEFCTGMAELQKAGAKQETVDTSTGSIFLVTSPHPEIVAKIHAHADKAIAEQKEMEAQQRN